MESELRSLYKSNVSSGIKGVKNIKNQVVLKLQEIFNNLKNLEFNFQNKFIIFCFILFLFLYGSYCFFKYEIPKLNIKSKVVVYVLILLKIAIISGFFINYHSYKINKVKVAPRGDKGEKGLSGPSGEKAKCDSGCASNLAFKKLSSYIISVINDWKITNGIEISGGKDITNLFLQKKIKDMSESKEYSKYLSKNGAGVLDKYLKDTLKKWILIILKYENGLLFLESVDLNDNNFDAMITKKDKKYASFDNMGVDGTPSEGKESPFDEIKKYDLWYWGANPYLKPKVVNVCKSKDNLEPIIKIKETNDYSKPSWGSTNSRQLRYKKFKKQIICIPVGFYPVCFPICKPVGNHFVANLQKGDNKVTVYKPNDYVDEKEDEKFKTFKPLGDVVYEGSYLQHKKPIGSTCLPEKKTDKCYKKFMQPGDPSQKTILVSGDVKRPIDYKQLYSSLRHRGHNAYNQGVTFWRPIPPKDYICMGDIVQNNPYNEKPSTDLIRCIPKKCVRKLKNSKNIWNSKKSPSDRCRSDAMCCSMEKKQTDIDYNPDYGEVNMHTNSSSQNMFRVRDPRFQDDNGQFYEIIPKGRLGDEGQKSCLDLETTEIVNKKTCEEKRKTNSNWVVPKKIDKKYSILQVYK